ncbi:wingless-type MMTV integration site family, member 5, partial [Schistosoma bovis]
MIYVFLIQRAYSFTCITKKSLLLHLDHNFEDNTRKNLGLLSWRTIHQSPAFLLAPKPLCLRVQGLTHSQAQLCQRYFDHMPVISIGAKLGIYECQRQFRFRHWNCSSDNEASAFGPVTLT